MVFLHLENADVIIGAPSGPFLSISAPKVLQKILDCGKNTFLALRKCLCTQLNFWGTSKNFRHCHGFNLHFPPCAMPTLHRCVPNTWLAAKKREKTAQNCPQTNAFHVSKMAARHPIGSCSAMATLPLLTFPAPKCAHGPWLHIGVRGWSSACCVAELLRVDHLNCLI